MTPVSIHPIETENLATHVELSALRFQHLDHRLHIIEEKVEILTDKIQRSHLSISKVIIGSSATVIAGLLSTVVTILLKF